VRRKPPHLLRLGGEAAVVGAVLVILFDFVQILDLSRPDPSISGGEVSEPVITVMYAQQLLSVVGQAVVALGLVALYVRQSQIGAQPRSIQVLALIGFLVAFVGTFFAVNVEDVGWEAELAADAGWALFGISALHARLYPRPASWLLLHSAIFKGLLNPIIVSFLVSQVGGASISSLFYEGSDAYYPIVYADLGVEMLFYVAVAWLGLALLLRTPTPADSPSRRRSEHEGVTSFGRFSAFRLRLLWVAVLVLGLLPIALIGGVLPVPGGRPLEPEVAEAETSDSACPSPAQATARVWGSSRLVVHNPCQHAVGTVHSLEVGEGDGDIDIFVTLEPEYSSLEGAPQNEDNVRRYGKGGDIAMELMPRDGWSTDPDTSEPRPAHIPAPSVGAKVDVWGAWVFDSSHGYYEIHPIFSMSTSSDGGKNWSEAYTSGPQHGGPPSSTPSAKRAYPKCRDENNNRCLGYYDPQSS